MKYILIYLSLFFLFVCCQMKSEVVLTDKRIPIPLSSNSLALLSPDSVFDSVTYIPLETTEDNLITNIDKVIATDSLIYILDKKQKEIFVFNVQGKYIKKLDRQGAGGKGYYLNVFDFRIENDLIYLLCTSNKSIMIYNLNFEYLNEIELNGSFTCFEFFEDYIYLYGDYTQESLNNIFVLKRNNDLYAQYSPFPKQQLGVGYNGYYLAQDSLDCYAYYPYQYNIYKLYPDREEVILQLNFDSDKIYPLELQTASSFDRDKYRMSISPEEWPIEIHGNLVCTSKYYIIPFVYKTLVHSIFYNKENGNVKTGIIFPSKKYPFANQNILPYQKNFIIQTISTEAIDALRTVGKQYLIPEILQNCSLDDNPILAIYKLKY